MNDNEEMILNKCIENTRTQQETLLKVYDKFKYGARYIIV